MKKEPRTIFYFGINGIGELDVSQENKNQTMIVIERQKIGIVDDSPVEA